MHRSWTLSLHFPKIHDEPENITGRKEGRESIPKKKKKTSRDITISFEKALALHETMTGPTKI